MKDIFLVMETLKHEVANNSPDKAFKIILTEMTKYYIENLNLDDDEVAILLIDKDKTILSFCQPEYLINSGMIPISSNEAIVSEIFKKGIDYIENNFQQQKHLNIFETIRTPDNEIKPIWKMIASIFDDGEERLGVIELSRRAVLKKMTGADFTQDDLTLLKESQEKFASLLKNVRPDNFRGELK